MKDQKPYILLVEDNPDDIELTMLAFRKNNFANDIQVVEDGEEALDFLFGDHPEGVSKRGLPMIILLDLMLPKIDGHEVLQEIKTKSPAKLVPVVILTSSKEEEDILKGYDLGANSYVRKPVDYHGFVEVVNSLGVYWLAVNQPILSDK